MADAILQQVQAELDKIRAAADAARAKVDPILDLGASLPIVGEKVGDAKIAVDALDAAIDAADDVVKKASAQ